ncbi:MAG: RHS repeat-associated core domain-containing protein [Phycisphaerales bacterium]|nr:RHS repeat-associated core domain-containing protein [Phycisphaerales bacterium]
MSDITGYGTAAGWTGPSVAYDWDGENRLVTVRPIEGTEAAGMSRVDFGYDSSWRRVRKTVTPWDAQTSDWASAPALDRKFLWSGWRMLLETDVPASGGEAVLRSFTWGLDLAGLNGAVNSLESAGTIGGLLAVRQYDLSGGPSPADPVDYVYLYDALGNVGQVVDWSHDAQQPGAALAARYEYDPYGGVTKAQGDYAADNAWRFSTKQWDDETGLGNWLFRPYSASMGRWLTRDPIEEEGGLHLFVYALNGPAGLYDPDGRAVPVVIVGGAALTTAQAVAASFGLTLAACLASPPCRQAIDDALRAAAQAAVEATKSAAREAARRCCRVLCKSRHPSWPYCTGHSTPEPVVLLKAAQEAQKSRPISANCRPGGPSTLCARLGSSGTVYYCWVNFITVRGYPEASVARMYTISCCNCCHTIRSGTMCIKAHRTGMGKAYEQPPPP